MAILNVTPDSFSDGGRFTKRDSVLRFLEEAAANRADIIDVGGESTRPGAKSVSEQEELDRVLPVVELIKSQSDLLVSVDTTKSRVAGAACAAGADLVNDISGGTFDSDMFKTVAAASVPYVLMHINGTPRNMQNNPQYADLISDISDFFARQTAAAKAAGVSDIILDVGIGFGKTFPQNFQLIRQLAAFEPLGFPLLIGASRKSFLAGKDKLPPMEREIGTVAVHTEAILNGARIVRSHHLAHTRQMLDVCEELLKMPRFKSR